MYKQTNMFPLLQLLQKPKPQKVLLSGYGVELAIKSTEYKAVDDTKVKGELASYHAVCTGSCCLC